MYLNYISQVFRQIFRYKTYSFLNILGLSIGMACAILIFLWVDNEVKTDKFFSKDLYIIRKQMKFSDGQITIDPAMTAPLAPAIAKEVPEVELAVRLTFGQRLLFQLDNKSFYEEGFYADTGFFKITRNSLKLGDEENVLHNSNSVVISEKLAEKYFLNENPVGKIIKIRGFKEEPYLVTGVFYNNPENSSIKYDFILPFSKYNHFLKDFLHWGNYNTLLLVLAKPNTNQNILSQKIDRVLKKHDQWAFETKAFARPLRDMYLYDSYQNSIDNPTGRILLVKIFSVVALFIIFLACMNYTNLATAIAIKRSKEVGVKKVFGSDKKRLVLQFTIEAMILTFIAFFISLVLVEFAIPHSKALLNKEIAVDFRSWSNLGKLVIIPFFTGILAGTFPAFYLSSFKPVIVLKSIFKSGKGSIRLRHFLVVFQFVITIVFIISSIVILKQINYIQSKTLGLDKENVIFFEQTLQIQSNRAKFKEELKKQEGVLNVSYTSTNPLEIYNSTADPTWRGKPKDKIFLFPFIAVDEDFTSTMGVEIIEGRNFTGKNDENGVLVNQEALKIMQFNNPVGEQIDYWGRKANIIGVVKDFHIGNLRIPIKQLLITYKPEETYLVMIKISGTKRNLALKNIQKVFKKFEVNTPFEYEFLDKRYEKNYEGEFYMSRFSNIFAALAIFISCLGLFGLALFTAEQKTKEIGVRKSMGAKTYQIMLLLGRDFMKWILISYAVASILAYILLSSWLNSFAYRTTLSWWSFAIAGFLTVLLALITVIWQSWKAASKNPVESLRYE